MHVRMCTQANVLTFGILELQLCVLILGILRMCSRQTYSYCVAALNLTGGPYLLGIGVGLQLLGRVSAGSRDT